MNIALTSLSDDELHAVVRRLTARSNVTRADLLAHFGEVEERGIHRDRAYANVVRTPTIGANPDPRTRVRRPWCVGTLAASVVKLGRGGVSSHVRTGDLHRSPHPPGGTDPPRAHQPARRRAGESAANQRAMRARVVL